jgi:hypothetical protein
MTAPRPSFFIVGAPKSGTTSLYDWLVGHPQVYMSPVKEPFYFCPDVQGGLRRLYAYPADEQRYLELFADARAGQVCGEASTRYLVSHEAPEHVREFAPGARAIAMLRNPVDMVHALHGERVSLGAEPIEDFATAMAADADRREGKHLPPNANPLGSVYRDTAMYSGQLERWFDALGRDCIHVIVFDDLTANGEAQFVRVLDFLGVDRDYRPQSFAASNRSHRVRGGPVRAVLNSAPAQWTAHRGLPAVLGENRTQRLARQFRMSRVNRERVARSSITPEMRAKLEADFRPDVERLSHLLDRDMTALWFRGG